MRKFVLSLIAGAAACLADGPPTRADLLEALNNAAATFSRTAPGLGARELLSQRGKRTTVLHGKSEKNTDFQISHDFTTHEVDSSWSIGPTAPLHEVRDVRSIDASPVSSEVRHALSVEARSADDRTKKHLLEDLERGKLEGAATDFVPMLLLFAGAKQANYEFRMSAPRRVDKTRMWVLRYHQTGGEDAFTEFRDRSETHEPAEGEIWFRPEDLLPIRVTLNVEEVLSPRYILRNEAEVNYTPSPFGLAPATVIHRQYLNRDLIMENLFRYSEYTGKGIAP